MNLHMLGHGAAAWVGLRPTPLSLTYELSHRCNLRCTYCDRHQAMPHELGTADIFRVLGEFHALGMRRISLDGGEPLLHRDIADVVDWLVRHDVVAVMNSNGILVPRRMDVVRRLKTVKISLDGPRACHEAMRGAGSFDRAMEGVVAAREAGVDVELTCVVGRHNADHLEELVQIVENLGVTIIFQPAVQSLVDPARDGSGWMLDDATARAAFATVERLKRCSKTIGNGWASLRHFRSFPEDLEPPCAAGWIMATLDPEGVLYHCDQDGRSDRSNNVLAQGVARAFTGLKRESCPQCWCARLVEGNYLWGCRIDKLLPPLRYQTTRLKFPG